MQHSCIFILSLPFIVVIVANWVFSVLMAQSQWKYIAQHGFFSHDNDPESWEFRATTLPRLGLLEREYPTNDTLESHTQSTQWEHFQRYVQQLNQEGAEKRRYKVFYIIRHGEGVHNVKEQEVGRAEWDVSDSNGPADVMRSTADLYKATLGKATRRWCDHLGRRRVGNQRRRASQRASSILD